MTYKEDKIQHKMDNEHLARLVMYAAEIYAKTTGKKLNKNFGTCDSMEGKLSQMSNILRGFSDSVDAMLAARGK